MSDLLEKMKRAAWKANDHAPDGTDPAREEMKAAARVVLDAMREYAEQETPGFPLECWFRDFAKEHDL